MVLVLRIPPQEALQSFADARGYDIERENYINSIISHHENSDLQKMIIENNSRLAPNSIPLPIREHSRNRSDDYYRGRSRHQNYYEERNYHQSRSQHRYHPFHPPASHRSGARQSNSGHYQRDKSFNRSYSSRRRRDDNQNYNNWFAHTFNGTIFKESLSVDSRKILSSIFMNFFWLRL